MRFCHVLLVLLLAACTASGDLAGARSRPQVRQLANGMVVARRIGTIEHFGSPTLINAPDGVAQGEQFVVEVTTYGSDCVGKGGMQVQVDGLSAVVTPYDWEVTRLPPNTGCRVAVVLHEHTASLGFDQAGDGRIVVRGRRKPSGEVITVVREIKMENRQ